MYNGRQASWQTANMSALALSLVSHQAWRLHCVCVEKITSWCEKDSGLMGGYVCSVIQSEKKAGRSVSWLISFLPPGGEGRRRGDASLEERKSVMCGRDGRRRQGQA